VAAGGGVFWMSQSQFFMMFGEGVQPLPCPVWDVVFQDIDTDYMNNVRAGANSRFSEVMWYYPTIGSAGVPTNYVKYNWLTQSWDYGELTRTAWIDQSVFGPPIGAGSDRYIYQHEMGQDADGAAMSSSFTTGWFALQEGDNLAFLDQFWPDMKWSLFGDENYGEVQITFYAAEYPGSTVRTFGPYTVTKETKFITPRIRTRLLAFKISSSDVGSFWRLGNCRYRGQSDGKFL
jgi:hypothetical protein